MKHIFITIILVLTIRGTAFLQADCDISTIGLEVLPDTIMVGQSAVFSFPIYNDGVDSNCTIPANSVTAILSFPSSVFAFDGLEHPVSGVGTFFTWTYDPAENVLLGINHDPIPNGEGDYTIQVRVIGTGVGTAQCILNIEQGNGVSNEVENDVGGPTFVTGIPFVCTTIVSSTADTGFGTLRNMIACASDGDTITYDQENAIDYSTLHQPLLIDKSIVIKGKSISEKPMIDVDFSKSAFATSQYGILISPNKVVTFKDIDFIDRANPSGKSLIQVDGSMRVTGSSTVTKL